MSKRRIIFILLLWLILGGSILQYHPTIATDDYTNRVIDQPGLLSYLPLNDTTGTVAIDSSGNNHPGTYHGATLNNIAGPGVLGNAPYFDGINDYIEWADLGEHSEFTFIFWTYPNTINRNDGWINTGSSTGGIGNDIFQYTGNLLYWRGGNVAHQASIDISGWVGNNWHFIAWTVSFVANRAIGYVDGSPQITLTPGATLGGPIELGIVDSNLYYHKGALGHVAIYDNALNETQVAYLTTPFAPPTPTPTLTPVPSATFTPRPPELIATLGNGNQWELDYRITAGDIALSLLGFIMVGLLAFFIIHKLVRR